MRLLAFWVCVYMTKTIGCVCVAARFYPQVFLIRNYLLEQSVISSCLFSFSCFQRHRIFKGTMQHEVESQRKRLPISAVKNKLLRHLEKHENIILIGETGCGKTTQVPQVLML